MRTPSPRVAQHPDPEPAPSGRGLSPPAPDGARRAFPGKPCLTWKVPACLEVIICNSAGCCRALDVKGNAPGSIFPPVQTAALCAGLHPHVATSPSHQGTNPGRCLAIPAWKCPFSPPFRCPRNEAGRDHIAAAVTGQSRPPHAYACIPLLPLQQVIRSSLPAAGGIQGHHKPLGSSLACPTKNKGKKNKLFAI